jgi:hypothetical protein
LIASSPLPRILDHVRLQEFHVPHDFDRLDTRRARQPEQRIAVDVTLEVLRE